MREDGPHRPTSAEQGLRQAIERSSAARKNRSRLLDIPSASQNTAMPDEPSELEVLRAALKEARDALRRRDRHIHELKAERDALKAARDELLASTSWRLTAPLRGLRRMGHGD